MNENDELDDDTETLSPEKAFRGSGSHEWGGQKLHPFTYSRKVAAMALGLRYWKLTPEEVESITDEIEIYNGIAHDATIVLWLCSVSEKTVHEAREKPRSFNSEICNWADKNMIFNPGSCIVNGAAIATFMRIVNDVNLSDGQPVIDQKSKKDSNIPNV